MVKSTNEAAETGVAWCMRIYHRKKACVHLRGMGEVLCEARKLTQENHRPHQPL